MKICLILWKTLTIIAPFSIFMSMLFKDSFSQTSGIIQCAYISKHITQFMFLYFTFVMNIIRFFFFLSKNFA